MPKRQVIPKQIVRKPTASELILMALQKAANYPFEVLIRHGEMMNQLRPTSVRMAARRLKKRNLICVERKGRKILFALTEEGEKAAEKVRLKLEMTKPRKWDGIWRIIVFDVPEKLRGKRDLLRKELINFGFRQLQKSVWAYPHPLPKEFIDLWEDAGILKHCIIFEASKIENVKIPM